MQSVPLVEINWISHRSDEQTQIQPRQPDQQTTRMMTPQLIVIDNYAARWQTIPLPAIQRIEPTCRSYLRPRPTLVD